MKENAIYINTIKPDLPSRLDYRKGNKARVGENALISFQGLSHQLFAVEGRGEGLAIGDEVFFTLKNSKTLVLPLLIKRIDYLIEPSDHWKAELEAAQAFDTLSIYTWQVECNVCHTVYPLEFVVWPESDQSEQVNQAEIRLAALGWGSESGKHICVKCQK